MGLDKGNRESLFQLLYLSTTGIAVALTIFGSFLFGHWLDSVFGTGNIIAFLFFFVGIFVSFKNAYRFIKKKVKEQNSADKQTKSGQNGEGNPADEDRDI